MGKGELTGIISPNIFQNDRSLIRKRHSEVACQVSDRYKNLGAIHPLTQTLGQLHPNGILNDLIACRSQFERLEAPDIGMEIPRNTSTKI